MCVCPFPFSAPSLPNFQVAIIAGNFDLAEIIKVHKASDVGKLTAVVVHNQADVVFYRFTCERRDIWLSWIVENLRKRYVMGASIWKCVEIKAMR